jgi:predicted ArsR family transcriptional regulator
VVDSERVARQEVFKALGDPTRYTIYCELASSHRPLATGEVAERLGLHPNTVRDHLERLREVGLLQSRTDLPSGVGRPQNLYSLVSDAPALGLEPPALPLLARLLVQMAERAQVSDDDARATGRQQGRIDALAYRAAPSCLEALVTQLDSQGFGTGVEGTDDGETAVISFTHCPFQDVADTHPRLVCSLHRGLVEGFVETMGDATVDDFHSLIHRQPCQVVVSTR